MCAFNGHKNWNHWNVSLWINNDESLYNTARDAVRHCKNRSEAADLMLTMLRDAQGTNKPVTPDGAPYTVTTIKAAMVGLS